MGYGPVNVPGAASAELAGKADASHKHKIADITDFPSSMTPASHASPETAYGAGSSANYGHVQLSDSTDSDSGADSGVAATPKAVKDTYDLAQKAMTAANEAKQTAEAAGKAAYVHTFSSGDWKAGSDEYTITIPAATHGLSGTVVTCRAFAKVSGGYTQNTWASETTYATIASGVITLHFPADMSVADGGYDGIAVLDAYA